MPSTARTAPAPVRKWTRRSCTSSNGRDEAGTLATSLLEAGIESIRQPVRQEIEPEHSDEDGSARRYGGPGCDLEGLVVEVQKLTPADRLRVAEAEEAHHRLGQDRSANAERDHDDE